MPFHERETIVSSLEIVNEVQAFDDDALGSCCAALEKIKATYPQDEIIFYQLSFRQILHLPYNPL